MIKKLFLEKVNKFLDWGIKKYGQDVDKCNEIISTKNILNKSFKVNEDSGEKK